MATREQSNQLYQVSSKFFDFAVLKKGNLLYLSISNNKHHLNSGKPFSDQEYMEMSLEKLFGVSLANSKVLTS